jgi:hypothetical protein
MAKTSGKKTTKPTDDGAKADSPVDSRLAIPLDKDGKILLDNMRGPNKEKLRDLLRDASVREALGVDDGPSVSDAPGPERIVGMALPPELMMPIVGGLSALETVIVARATGAPPDLILRYAPYSREEREQIAPLLAAVLNKRMGSVFEKWGEEFALLAALSMMTIAKIGAVNAELERRGPGPRVVPFAGQVETPTVPGEPGEPSTEPAQ